MVLMLITVIIAIIVIICNYFIYNVFKPEHSKIAELRPAYTLIMMLICNY